MEKKIEIFEVEIEDFNTDKTRKFTCLSVPTKLGYSVGVAPQSLEDLIQEHIEGENYSCNDAITSVDEKYGYVLYDKDIEHYLATGDATDIFDHLNDCDEDAFWRYDEIKNN